MEKSRSDAPRTTATQANGTNQSIGPAATSAHEGRHRDEGSGAFRGPDIAGELPKRHSLRRGETVADLRRRQAGREEEAVLVNRRSVEGVPARGFEQPASLFKRGLARFDSLL